MLVNEIYGPVEQGEGKSAGMECLFLRLSGCNLACIWCDTPYTWNWTGTKFEHPDKYDQKLEAHKLSVEEVKFSLYSKVKKVKNLVISGGEPMLQQGQLILLLNDLKKEGWWVEIETNGTIEPLPEFDSLIDQYNCSPKLSNAGRDNPRKKRLIANALNTINKSTKATFKFVIQSSVDLEEMREILLLHHISPDKVWLMPEGRTKEEQLTRQEEIKKLSEVGKYNFSPRLHILMFGNKRGV